MKFRIVDSKFERSIPERRLIPEAEHPEIAFVGRSNVGKSSLLNALCQRRSLAIASKTPGRTRALNYFSVDFICEDEAETTRLTASFVDLPGFGFSKVSKQEQKAWANLVHGYLFESHALRAILILVDSRRGIQEEELTLFDLEIPARRILVLTKADKLTKRELQDAKQKAADVLGCAPAEILATGLVGKRKYNVEPLVDEIGAQLLP